MDVSKREWWIRTPQGEEGPIPEDDFQGRLRAGEIPLHADIKSNFMDGWKPLLEVISNDDTFRRQSSPPPDPFADSQ